MESVDEYKTPEPKLIKEGIKVFLDLQEEIEKEQDAWFKRFGDESLQKHLIKKYYKECAECAILFYNRLDCSNKTNMVGYSNEESAKAASDTSLGITSYMCYYDFIEIYGKETAEKCWEYVSYEAICGAGKKGGICELFKMSSDEHIDKIIKFIEEKVKRFNV
jgi:hypothetical protein